MNGDDLTRASTRIRHDVDYDQAHGDDAFLLAVADWLDLEAKSYGPSDCALAVARAYLGADL